MTPDLERAARALLAAWDAETHARNSVAVTAAIGRLREALEAEVEEPAGPPPCGSLDRLREVLVPWSAANNALFAAHDRNAPDEEQSMLCDRLIDAEVEVQAVMVDLGWCSWMHFDGDPPGPSPALVVQQVQRPRVVVTLGNPATRPIPFRYYDPAAGLEIRGEIGEDGEVTGRATWRRGKP